MSGLPDPPEGGVPGTGAAGRNIRPDQRLGRNQRLLRSSSFQEAFSQQQKWVGRYMVLWLRAGDDACLRLGIVSSRKVGGAVQRARARRQLREAFRRQRHLLSGRVDLVLVARASLRTASRNDIEQDFMALAAKAGIASPA